MPADKPRNDKKPTMEPKRPQGPLDYIRRFTNAGRQRRPNQSGQRHGSKQIEKLEKQGDL